ncbi:MAG: hypothetical protein CMJ59_06985 [Planctomycetaceae bacterium]|nr:hypothetical protein [Planctomycetaceae bacterium]
MNVSRGIKFTRVLDAVAAGTSDQNSSSVDMKSYDAVTFVVGFGAITASAVTSIKLQGSDDDLSFSDLAGTAITVADSDDDKIVLSEINQPQQRYVRCVVDRGTQNAVIDFAVALQNKANKAPVTQSSTVLGSEFHQAPAAGTA